MKFHSTLVLSISNIFASRAAADLSKGHSFVGGVKYSSLGADAEKAFNETRLDDFYSVQQNDFALKLRVADVLVNGTNRVRTTALLSLEASDDRPDNVTSFCFVPYVINNQTLQDIARNDHGNCSSFMSEKCLADIRGGGHDICSGEKPTFPKSCGFTGEAYPITYGMNIVNKTGFFTFQSQPHEKGDKAASEEVELAVWPVLVSTRTNHTSKYTNSNQTFDWSNGASGVTCLRAGNVVQLPKPTVTTTSSSAFAAPTAMMKTENLLGVAVVAAAWGLVGN